MIANTIATTNINVRIDKDLKQDFERTLSDLGMSFTTAFTVFAKAVVRTESIPFPVSMNDSLYSAANIKRLKSSLAHAKQGKLIEKSLGELDAMADE